MKIISVQPIPKSTGCLPVLQEVEYEFDIKNVKIAKQTTLTCSA